MEPIEGQIKPEIVAKVTDAMLATDLDIVLWPRYIVEQLAIAAIQAHNEWIMENIPYAKSE